jgi:hypothetical protein
LAALANGGAVFYGGGNDHGMFDGPISLHRNLMKSIFSQLKKRADYMEGETVKYVALHCSQQTRDFRPSSIAQYGLRTTKGAYDMLNQSHLLVDIVFDEQMKSKELSDYRVLFLSNSACLSEKQGNEIRRFVVQGGTLIATHETSLFDELGQKRANFLLADVFGLNYRAAEAKGAIHGIVYVPQDLTLSREFGYLISFAGEESIVSLRSDSHVEVLCTRSNLKGEKPLDNFDPKVNYGSSEPAVTISHFGKGRAIYINGDVGAGYIHNPYPPLKRFVEHLVKLTKPPLEVVAPRVIEVTAARRSPKELMIHLLNNPTPLIPFTTSKKDGTTYFYLEEVNPIYNIEIKFNDFKIKRAEMPLQGLRLELSGEPDTVVVPEVKLHEVVLLELST